jgi:NADP-dependent 3-hydroxy acid dehydrogenase YdfG
MTQRSPAVLATGASSGRGVATRHAFAENSFEVSTPTRSGSRQVSRIEHDTSSTT